MTNIIVLTVRVGIFKCPQINVFEETAIQKRIKILTFDKTKNVMKPHKINYQITYKDYIFTIPLKKEFGRVLYLFSLF